MMGAWGFAAVGGQSGWGEMERENGSGCFRRAELGDGCLGECPVGWVGWVGWVGVKKGRGREASPNRLRGNTATPPPWSECMAGAALPGTNVSRSGPYALVGARAYCALALLGAAWKETTQTERGGQVVHRAWALCSPPPPPPNTHTTHHPRPHPHTNSSSGMADSKVIPLGRRPDSEDDRVLLPPGAPSSSSSSSSSTTTASTTASSSREAPEPHRLPLGQPSNSSQNYEDNESELARLFEEERMHHPPHRDPTPTTTAAAAAARARAAKEEAATHAALQRQTRQRALLRWVINLSMAVIIETIYLFISFASSTLLTAKAGLEVHAPAPGSKYAVKLFFSCMYASVAFLMVYLVPTAAGSGIPETKAFLNGIRSVPPPLHPPHHNLHTQTNPSHPSTNTATPKTESPTCRAGARWPPRWWAPCLPWGRACPWASTAR